MLRFFCLVLLSLSLLQLPATASADELDRLLSALLIGTWEEGNVPYGIVTFRQDGTYAAKMFSTKAKETLLLTLEGSWKIVDSELQSLLTGSNSLNAPIGESFSDQIVQVNRNELVLIGMDGKRYSKYRVVPEPD